MMSFAAGTSGSVKKFSSKGNWETVAAIAFGGVVDTTNKISNAQTPTSTPTNASHGSTGRTEPADLMKNQLWNK